MDIGGILEERNPTQLLKSFAAAQSRQLPLSNQAAKVAAKEAVFYENAQSEPALEDGQQDFIVVDGGQESFPSMFSKDILSSGSLSPTADV